MTTDVRDATAHMRRTPRIAGKARDALVGTGAFTVAVVCLSFVTIADAGAEKRSETLGAMVTLSVIGMAFGGLWGYLAQTNWMSDATEAVSARGYKTQAGWNVWVAWFIPVYNLVVPFVMMRRLSAPVESARTRVAVIAWWAGFVLAVAANRTGLGVDNAALESVVTMIAIVVSYAGLVVLIRTISAHLDKPFTTATAA